jgi:hypothetical protein
LPQGSRPLELRLWLDQVRQTFNPKLDVAKQLGREIFRPQLACQGKNCHLKLGNWEI